MKKKQGRYAQESVEEPQSEEPKRISSRARAWVLLLLAATVCISAISMCLILIKRSGEPTQQREKEVSFSLEKGKIEQPSTPDVTVEEQTPVSANNSERLNILLFSRDEQTNTTDTVVLLSVNIPTKEVALLSFPRDTFISGNYQEPKINRIYGEAKTEERGISAIKESVEDMVGFAVDYYFILDEDSLTAAVNCVGGISFEVPAEPAYSTLSAGTRTLTGEDAYKLLCFDEAYDTVSVEPTQVQRRLLQQLLDALLSDQEHLAENAIAIADASETDLNAQLLVYFGTLLADSRFSAGFSRALPGVEINAGGMDFYQVNPEEALPLINSSFNPLDEELTTFSLNFRQLTGDSTDGEMAPFGFSGGGNDDDDDDNNDEETAPATEPDTVPETIPDTQAPTEP